VPAACCLIVLLLLTPAAVADDATTINLTLYQIERNWDLNWKYYGSRYVKLGDTHYPLSRWNDRFPSSAHRTPEMIIHESTKYIEQRVSATMVKRVRIQLPREDGVAGATALPAIEPGHYGYLHSFEIDEILDKDLMLVEDIWLVVEDDVEEAYDRREKELEGRGVERDTAESVAESEFQYRLRLIDRQDDRSFRNKVVVQGIDTEPLDRKMRWPRKPPHRWGVQLAIIGTIEVGERRKKTYPLAAPVDYLLKRTLDEQAFLAMLEARGIDKEQFCRIILAAKQEDPDTVEAPTFAAIEAARPQQPPPDDED